MIDTISMNRRGALAAGAGALLMGAARPGWAFAAAKDDADAIDAIVRSFMDAFEIPGIGVAIVRPGEPAFTRGYGVRALGRPEPVDSDTLFAIASNSKAFTAATLAILVEQGKLGWDEPVVKYMPDFAMHDPAVTQMVTVRDLLVHRSGLALGAGDLMQFPKSDRTAEELLRALPHFALARGFRSGYAYDNILYVVAGILVERVSGLSWQDFVARNIFRPLGMTHSVADPTLIRSSNVAGRHARVGPPVRGMGPLVVVEPDESAVVAAAGGIQTSVADIVPWLQTQLGNGQAAGLPRLWSEAQTKEMWTPQIFVSSTTGPDEENPTRSVLSGYALGWYISEYRDHRLVSHSGGLSGQITVTALLPEQKIGLAVYSNIEDNALYFLRYALLDYLLGVPSPDWIVLNRRAVDKYQADARKLATESGEIKAPPGKPSLPLAAYTGRYRDIWYGDIVVSLKAGKLMINFTRTPVFKGPLETWGPDAFRTRWAKGAGEDAVVTFTITNGAVTGMKLKALSPLADFSYDFHDLDPRRVP